jgi:hypothetical protein
MTVTDIALRQGVSLARKRARQLADQAAGLTRGLDIRYPEVGNAVWDYFALPQRGELSPAGQRIASRFDQLIPGQMLNDRLPESFPRWIRSIGDRELRSLRRNVPEAAGKTKQELERAGLWVPTTAEQLSRGLGDYTPKALEAISSGLLPRGAVDRPVVHHLLALANQGMAIPENRAIGGNLYNFLLGHMVSPDELNKILREAGKKAGRTEGTITDTLDAFSSLGNLFS